MLPHKLLELPVDKLAVDLAVARMAVEAELKALEDARKGKEKKKPKTKDEYRKNMASLEQLNKMQGK